jgi:hypothetical protein
VTSAQSTGLRQPTNKQQAAGRHRCGASLDKQLAPPKCVNGGCTRAMHGRVVRCRALRSWVKGTALALAVITTALTLTGVGLPKEDSEVIDPHELVRHPRAARSGPPPTRDQDRDERGKHQRDAVGDALAGNVMHTPRPPPTQPPPRTRPPVPHRTVAPAPPPTMSVHKHEGQFGLHGELQMPPLGYGGHSFISDEDRRFIGRNVSDYRDTGE